ncbi:MAG TPA: hypothetical protein VF100_06125 [Thermoanaerobaculia bacterium]
MSRRALVKRAPAAALALALVACGGRAEPGTAGPYHEGPVVLITVGGLRADATGFLGGEPATLTPHLDALAAEADWAGAAVAPSSVGLVSLASYLTGLGAWAHGVGLGPEPLRLPPELRTLAEALGERGYRGAAYVPGWMEATPGWGQGFGLIRDLAGGGRAAGHLASLDGGRDLVWIHLADAEAPFARQDGFLARLPAMPAEAAAALPRRRTPADLERLRDPAASPAERDAALAVYRLAVAGTDQRLGELIAALRSGGRAGEAIVVVAATHGQELFDDAGWGLARPRVEVPLVVDLPPRLAARWRPRLPPAGSRPAAARLWATLAEAVGAAVPPAPAPPLTAGPAGALSELHLGDGVNEASWVEGDLQLLRRVRFAPPEEDFRLVRLARMGAAPPAVADPRALVAAAEERCAATPAWGGRGEPETRLVAWRPDGAVAAADGPAAAARRRAFEAAMARARNAFTPCDQTPAAAAAARAAERRAAGEQ